LKIKSGKPLVIAELKRSAPRSAKDAGEFGDKLSHLMWLAIDDAEKQARLAFEVPLYKEFDGIILIAACGEWWRFTLATRGGMALDGIYNYFDNPEEDDDDKVSYKHPSRGERDGPRVSAAVRRYTDLKNVDMDAYKTDVEDAMPPAGQWSNYILFGTKASNQRLFLIHRWLKEQRGKVHLTYDEVAEVRFSTQTFELEVCSPI
jgi:hypothetical protein